MVEGGRRLERTSSSASKRKLRGTHVQCYQKDELRPERLEELWPVPALRRSTFSTAGSRTSANSRLLVRGRRRRLEEYLTSALPLTRHLFKNLLIVAS